MRESWPRPAPQRGAQLPACSLQPTRLPLALAWCRSRRASRPTALLLYHSVQLPPARSSPQAFVAVELAWRLALLLSRHVREQAGTKSAHLSEQD